MSEVAPVILVVEDDDDIRLALLETLDEEGFAAVGAPGALEALELLRSGAVRPALVLLDLMMPRVSGAEFRAAQLRDPALADIPVVVFSAAAGAEAAARELGAVGCLTKPVTVAALIAAVRRHTGRAG